MIRSLLSRLTVIRYALMRSFWFLPGLMALSGAALAFVTGNVAQDNPLERFLEEREAIAAGPEAARTILATTVGSTITVTSLVFSMVLLALSQAAQQLGPRLLQEFTGDRLNQVVLGGFVATFVHALLTLGTAGEPISSVAVLTSILLALASFVMLVFFLHHTAQLMQADYVLARVSRDLVRAIKASWPADGSGDEPAAPAWSDSDEGDAIVAPASGYIQTVDYERLVDLAAERDLRLRLDYRPGHFIVAGVMIGLCAPAGRSSDGARAEIVDAIVIGRVRTAAQDLEFSIKAMVEIALRALSTGVNDTFTAIAAIDELGAALGEAMRRRIPPQALADRNGTVRLVRDRIDFEGLVAASYHPLRQNIGGNVTAIIRLIDVLGELARLAPDRERAAILLHHLERTEELAERSIPDEHDRHDARSRSVTARQRLAQAQDRAN